jgi:hypothetical protein
MIVKLPTNTQTYLVSLMEYNIAQNPHDSAFAEKRLYEEWYNPIDWVKGAVDKGIEFGKAAYGPSDEERAKQRKEAKEKEAPTKKVTTGGGFGKGDMGQSAPKPHGFMTTLMGDSEEVGEEDSPILKLLGAGGLGILGGVAGAAGQAGAGLVKGLGQSLKKFGLLGNIGGSALEYGAKGIASLGKQAEEISGKTWAEDQFAKIGQSQMELAAQGAGSPWTPFVLSNKKQQKIISPQERQAAAYDAETKRLSGELQARDVRSKAKAAGLIP